MNKPLLVLDTNVVLDLFHFADAAALPLLRALEAGDVRCATNSATLDEWRRVLGYPEFRFDASRQVGLMSLYAALSVDCGSVAVPALRLRCSDPDDQKFLELSLSSGAQALITRDRALLKLRRRCAPMFQIMPPAEAVQWLSGSARSAP